MSKKHDAIFDDVLSGLDSPAPSSDRGGARFLKRSTSIGERMSGEILPVAVCGNVTTVTMPF